MNRLQKQLAVTSGLAILALAWQTSLAPGWQDLWLTRDQQGRMAYDSLDFQGAADLFEDATWAGVSNYEAGNYEIAATQFAASRTGTSAFNQGNALMKARKYSNAVNAYELAVLEAPDWQAARDNLSLARYTRDYIERAREQGDTGDESELSADGFEFDNQSDKGTEMTITNESVMQAASAEKWMRSVNTETREFLQQRFALEASRSP